MMFSPGIPYSSKLARQQYASSSCPYTQMETETNPLICFSEIEILFTTFSGLVVYRYAMSEFVESIGSVCFTVDDEHVFWVFVFRSLPNLVLLAAEKEEQVVRYRCVVV